jgi:hypothetical protein
MAEYRYRLAGPADGQRRVFRHLRVVQRFVRAVDHTYRYFLVLAEVALDHLLLCRIEFRYAQGAYQGAGAATDAPFFIHGDQRSQRVAGHSTGETGPDAGGVSAVLAAYRERYDAAFVHTEPGQWARALFFISPEQVPGPGMLEAAIDLAEVAADAGLFFDKYLFHYVPPRIRYAVTVYRLLILSCYR